MGIGTVGAARRSLGAGLLMFALAGCSQDEVIATSTQELLADATSSTSSVAPPALALNEETTTTVSANADSDAPVDFCESSGFQELVPGEQPSFEDVEECEEEVEQAPSTAAIDAAEVPEVDGEICEWLGDTVFSSGGRVLYFRTLGRYSEVEGDDWVSASDIKCVNDQLIDVDADNFDAPLQLRVDNGHLLAVSAEGGRFVATRISIAVTPSIPVTDPSRQRAMDLGVQLVESIIEDDADAFINLFADEIVVTSEPGLVLSRAEILEVATEEGSLFGRDYSGYTIDDYLRRYEIEVLTVDEYAQLYEFSAAGIAQAFPDEPVLVFVGSSVRPDAVGFISEDLARWVLREGSDGWHVVAALD